ncbi:glycosyltransferase [Exiguobacterium mexicanum]|uniref:glycosyltransferase n=1 Tax=Exiguobacterium mexicanum TaxID=340146 RepID=UPI00361C4E14
MPKQESYNLANNEVITIGYLARAEEPKNVERFIEIAHAFRLKYSNKNVRFIFGGSGKNISYIEEQVNKEKENSNIQLMGMVNKEKFFNQIDLYMSTSKYEGLPFSVIEAMSYKKPLFLSEINGHIDFRQSEATQLFKLNESDSNIVDQINEFIYDEDFPKYKNDIYDEFLNSFSVLDMVFKIRKLYDSL